MQERAIRQVSAQNKLVIICLKHVVVVGFRLRSYIFIERMALPEARIAYIAAKTQDDIDRSVIGALEVLNMASVPIGVEM